MYKQLFSQSLKYWTCVKASLYYRNISCQCETGKAFAMLSFYLFNHKNIFKVSINKINRSLDLQTVAFANLRVRKFLFFNVRFLGPRRSSDLLILLLIYRFLSVQILALIHPQIRDSWNNKWIEHIISSLSAVRFLPGHTTRSNLQANVQLIDLHHGFPSSAILNVHFFLFKLLPFISLFKA